MTSALLQEELLYNMGNHTYSYTSYIKLLCIQVLSIVLKQAVCVDVCFFLRCLGQRKRRALALLMPKTHVKTTSGEPVASVE